MLSQRILLRISKVFVDLLRLLVPVLNWLWHIMLILVSIALLLLLAILIF